MLTYISTIDLRQLDKVKEVDKTSRAALIEGGTYGPALEAPRRERDNTQRLQGAGRDVRTRDGIIDKHHVHVAADEALNRRARAAIWHFVELDARRLLEQHGTIVSPWRYDAGAATRPAHLRRPAILHRGSSTSAV
jgi:hypothetical protein